MENEQMPQVPQTNEVSPKSGKNKIVLPIILCAIVALLIVAGIVLRVVTSSPKAVFKNTINNGYKYIDNALEESKEYYKMFDVQKDAITISADVKADVDLEDAEDWAKDIKDVKLSGKAGIDIPNKGIIAEGEIAGKKEKVSAKVYVEDKDIYVESNLLEKPVKLSSEEIGDDFDLDWDELSEQLEKVTKDIDTNPETYQSITKAVKNALVKALDSEYMSKTKDEIDVNGKDVKVTKYSYEFKEKAIKGIVENMADSLLDDSDFISNLAKATGQDKKDIKDVIKELKKSAKEIEIDKDEVVTLNVYTTGLLNKFAGLSVEFDGKEVITYTTKGKDSELVINAGEDKVVVSIEKTGKDSYTVEAKYNKEKIAKVEVKEFNNEKIDLEYEVNVDDEKIEGSIYLTQDKSKSKVSGDYKVEFKYEKNSIKVEGSYAIESSKELDGVDTKSAVSSKEVDTTKIKNKYDEIKKNDPALGELLDEILDNSDVEPVTPVTPVEPDKTTGPIKDYYGFYTVGYDEGAVKGLLAKREATVIYVGSEYYTGDQAKTFESLKSLHGEMSFTSYYFPYYRASYDEDYLAAIKGINPQCNSSKCEEYPTVLLVKDGKVQKMLRGNYDKEALKKVLTEFGIN